MTRPVASFAFLSALAALGFAAGPATFEVASIRPSQPGKRTLETGPDSVTIRSVRLGECIAWAYQLADYQVSGPPWLSEAFFDITAKASGPATEDELRQMTQKLLEDRFQMASHRLVKEMPALILTVGKNGHKLEATEKEGSPSFSTGKMNLTGRGATVAQLVEFLSRQLKQPVLDQTGLTGRFNYFLDVNAYVTDEMRQSNGPPVEAGGIISAAVQSQLGLKVEARKAPIDVLIIDRIEKTPSEN